MTLYFLNDVTNEAESTLKIKNYVSTASLKSETIGKLINGIPGLRLFIPSDEPTKLKGYSFGVVRPFRPSVHTFCLSGTISQYLLVRFD